MNPTQTETNDEETRPTEQDAGFETEAYDHDDGLVHNHDWASTSYGR